MAESELSVAACLHALDQLSPMPDDPVLEQHPDQIDAYATLRETLGRQVGERFDPAVVRTVVFSFGSGDGFAVYLTTLHLIERQRGSETYALIREAVEQDAPDARKWGRLMLGRRRDPADLLVLFGRLNAPEPGWSSKRCAPLDSSLDDTQSLRRSQRYRR